MDFRLSVPRRGTIFYLHRCDAPRLGSQGLEKSLCQANTTGFSDATYSAVCAVLGVGESARNVGLHHALCKIERELRGTRFTIGDIAARCSRSVLKIVESAARIEQLNENA
jgi:hypothetical protein